jgi:hypothetical protein
VDDKEVIAAFAGGGSRNAFGPIVHVERDVLLLGGWWHTAVRVAPDTFIVRNEDPPFECDVLADVAAQLSSQGLRQVGADLPGIQAVTYAELSMGASSWSLWAPDLESGEKALAATVSADTFLSGAGVGDPTHDVDFSAELGGARRVAGLPPALILAVGVDPGHTSQLEGAFRDCRLMTTTFDETAPSACGTLVPSLILIDATDRTGREFIMELRTEACGRFLPVAALTEDGTAPLGADVGLDPAAGPAAWVEPIRSLLP